MPVDEGAINLEVSSARHGGKLHDCALDRERLELEIESGPRARRWRQCQVDGTKCFSVTESKHIKAIRHAEASAGIRRPRSDASTSPVVVAGRSTRRFPSGRRRARRRIREAAEEDRGARDHASVRKVTDRPHGHEHGEDRQIMNRPAGVRTALAMPRRQRMRIAKTAAQAVPEASAEPARRPGCPGGARLLRGGDRRQ